MGFIYHCAFVILSTVIRIKCTKFNTFFSAAIYRIILLKCVGLCGLKQFRICFLENFFRSLQRGIEITHVKQKKCFFRCFVHLKSRNLVHSEANGWEIATYTTRHKRAFCVRADGFPDVLLSCNKKICKIVTAILFRGPKWR